MERQEKLRQQPVSKHLPLKQSGFSLVEVLLAISILIIVMGAVTSIAVGSIKSSRLGKERIVAYELSREQLERLKQVRNTNLIDNVSTTQWDTGLNPGLRDYHVEFNNADDNFKLTPGKKRVVRKGIAYEASMNLDQINFSQSQVDGEPAVKATVNVDWTNKENDYQVTLSTYLTDWMWGYE